MGYKPDKWSLSKVLNQVKDGQLGIPEFQRDFKWDPKKTTSLIASILKEFPIGSLLTWVPGKTEFGRRSIHRAPELSKSSSVSLVLDGQQRTTSIFMALCLNPSREWEKGKERKNTDPTYWIDLKAFLESPDEPDEFITYSRPVFRKGKYTSSRVFDLKTRKMARFDELNGVKYGYVPLFQVYNAFAQNIDFSEHDLDPSLNDKLLRLRDELLQYTIPIIEIDQTTGIESVAFIFGGLLN